ncbi:glutathione S-transferase family protein [Lysobacter soyae]|uniref:Glutathione S-transferase family protein n=1 Tax=Lysobacter soyae TaxID=2764185 RepID=A0ABX8WN51_9GAMM|nr:glutathione S-transferase family protein [Lysobacter sp. CJ11]QYR52799.1 glutathione S-transferase family protein [Lysobacter sp. CJ11]
MKKPVFYTNPMSRGRITRWMLEETGLDYDTVVLDYETSMKADEYLAINPMGKVPAIVHNDHVVTENSAIILYLADLVPEKKLAPAPGSLLRGDYYRWIAFLSGPFEAFMTAKTAGALAKPTAAGYGNEADLFNTLDSALGKGMFLAGDHFTAADLYMAAYLGFYQRFKLLPDKPLYSDYVAFHMSRPACNAAQAKDNALMPQT